MNAYIINFQAPKNYSELLDCLESSGYTNIDIILNDAKLGETNWTVPRDAHLGDLIFFMCAKTSIDHMAHVVVEAKKYGSERELAFSQVKKDLYAKYAGSIIAVGKILEDPYQSEYDDKIYRADVSFNCLDEIINISEFRSFITVSRTGAITKLDDKQKMNLLELVANTNEDYKKEHACSLTKDMLKKIAIEHSSNSIRNVAAVNHKYIRDPYISLYTKERANGICQLCEKEAPFNDLDGKPYLESHHIIWLSKGGKDSVQNTTALCPNCHKKMHIVASQKDIEYLIEKNSTL